MDRIEVSAVTEKAPSQLSYQDRMLALRQRIHSRTDMLARNEGITPNAHIDVSLHLGPTNSGKTYTALQVIAQRYAERGEGIIYAAPLRMIAQEMFERLAEELGPDHVGLLTGDESRNPDAPVLCCTVDVAPHSGQLLVLDEVHWYSDPDRGWQWTRLVTGIGYPEMIIIGPTECEPTVRTLLAMNGVLHTVTTKIHQRKVPLVYRGSLCLRTAVPEGEKHQRNTLPSGTIVVAFSRSEVRRITQNLNARGIRATCLYGSMPPSVRHAQIEKFTSGDCDVIVSTDVIGHGINLPADHIVFADVVKFDGNGFRPLHTWEIAQIAGRAGRYGISKTGRGSVWIDDDVENRKDATRRVITGVEVAAGRRTCEELTEMRPVLHPDDVSCLELAEYGDQPLLPFALDVWLHEAVSRGAGGPIEPVVPPKLRKNLLAVLGSMGVPTDDTLLELTDNEQWVLPVSRIWSIATLPVLTSTIEALTRWEVMGRPIGFWKDHISSIAADEVVAAGDRDEVEHSLRELHDIRAVLTLRMFHQDVYPSDIRNVDHRHGSLMERLSELIRQADALAFRPWTGVNPQHSQKSRRGSGKQQYRNNSRRR